MNHGDIDYELAKELGNEIIDCIEESLDDQHAVRHQEIVVALVGVITTVVKSCPCLSREEAVGMLRASLCATVRAPVGVGGYRN